MLAHAIAPGTVRLVTHHDVDDAGVAARRRRTGGRAVKVRIGISAGGESLGPEAMVALAQGITGYRLRLPVAARGPDAARVPTRWSGWPGRRAPARAQDRDDHAAARPQPGVAGQGGGDARRAVGRSLPAHVRPRAGPGWRAQRHRHPQRRRGPSRWRTPCRCCAGCGPARSSATTARPAPSPTSRSRRGRRRIPSTSGWAATSRPRSSVAGAWRTGGSPPSARRPTPPTARR